MALAAVWPLSGFFELQRHHRDAVDRQHHIQRLLRVQAEMQLSGQPEAIGLIARFQVRIQSMGGAEEGNAQRLAETLEAVAQGGQRAMGVQPFAQRFQHPCAGLLAVQCFQLLPHLALGGADKGQRLIREDRPLAVEALGIDPQITIGQQDGLDGGFEGGFAGGFHHGILCLSDCLVKETVCSQSIASLQ
jgi:hypothetical protein